MIKRSSPPRATQWDDEFENTLEEVVLQRATGKYYKGRGGPEKHQAALDWLRNKKDQRDRLATRRFRMVFWPSLIAAIVATIALIAAI